MHSSFRIISVAIARQGVVLTWAGAGFAVPTSVLSRPFLKVGFSASMAVSYALHHFVSLQ